jgi:hypothetical protein
MLIRLFVPWLALVAFLGFAVGASLFSQPSRCFQYGKSEGSSQAAHDDSHTPIVSLGNQQQTSPETTDAEHDCNPWWGPHWMLVWVTLILCAITGALAAYTAFLYRTTRDIALDSRETAKLARAEFNATHRPRIGIRGVHTLTRDKEGFLGFSYVNRGIGDAKVTAIGCTVIVAEFIRNAPAFEIKNISEAVLKSGDSVFYEYSPHNIGEFSMGRGFQDGADPRSTSSTAFFVGFVTYEDGTGRKRETGFCRKNAPGTDLWEMVENSGYEYED